MVASNRKEGKGHVCAIIMLQKGCLLPRVHVACVLSGE
jgi:hypothetical protein